MLLLITPRVSLMLSAVHCLKMMWGDSNGAVHESCLKLIRGWIYQKIKGGILDMKNQNCHALSDYAKGYLMDWHCWELGLGNALNYR